MNAIAHLRLRLAAAGRADELVVHRGYLHQLYRLVYQNPGDQTLPGGDGYSHKCKVPRKRLEEALDAFGRVLAAAGWTLDEFAAEWIDDIAQALGDITAAHVLGLTRPYFDSRPGVDIPF